MKHALSFLLWLAAGEGYGASIRTEVTCPQESHESCRWEISARAERGSAGVRVEMAWEKSVQSRHWEKPLAHTLQCNVDRDFDPAGGGYLKVWFSGEKDACDAMAGNPADCGVTFHLEDPKQLFSSYALTVEAPAGKKLAKVELLSSLNVQCGNFGGKDFVRGTWRPLVGWSESAPGDGTYQSGAPAVAN